MNSSRTLARTQDVAHHLGMTVPVFLVWARRSGLRPAKRQRIGRSTVAWWDVDEAFDIEQEHPTYRPRRA